MRSEPGGASWGSGPTEWSDVTEARLTPAITARSLAGQQLSVTVFSLQPDAVVPEHAHPNDEFGYVIDGALRVWSGSDVYDVVAGGSFFVARDEPHRAVASARGCQLLECYAPPRVPAPPTQSRNS